MPALPSWLADPLWDQFAALLPPRPTYVPTLWVPETLRTLCDVLILVDQSAEPIVSSDVVDRGWDAVGEGP